MDVFFYIYGKQIFSLDGSSNYLQISKRKVLTACIKQQFDKEL